MAELRPPPECANCGATIPPGSRACPECGADERTGWRETSLYDGLDLPESSWNERTDDAEREQRKAVRRVNGIAWHWWLVGVVLIALLVLAVSGLR